MKKFMGVVAMISLAALPALAQGREDLGGNQHPAPPPQRAVGGGHIPQREPAPAPRAPAPVPQRAMDHDRSHPTAPHVDVRNNVWVGHDVRRDEPDFVSPVPWEHGHFPGVFGPSHPSISSARRRFPPLSIRRIFL